MATRKTKTTSKGTAVAEIKNSISTAPQFIQDEAAVGNENVGSEDITIPRLALLQELSPEVKPRNQKYVEGAKAGLLINSLTKELSESLRLINLHQHREFPVFVKRAAGGGFKGSFVTKAEAEDFVDTQPNKTTLEVVETVNHFCLVVDENNEPVGEVIIPMTSTKLGFSRSWNSMIIARKGPRFGSIWTLSTVLQANSQGQEYYNLTIAAPGEWVPTQELLNIAKEKHAVVSQMAGSASKFEKAA